MTKVLKQFPLVDQASLPLLAIFTIWLFHLSALIGISLGYEEWFYAQTPLNLSIVAFIMVLFYPINTRKQWYVTMCAFFTGMFVEWVGVHNDFLFGPYSYGSNLGLKLDGVPWMIGVNWAVLVLITAGISAKVFRNSVLKIVSGAGLMVFLDLFIEMSAPKMDMWQFEVSPVPIRNYITWFLVAAVLHTVYRFSGVKGNFRLSLHIYLAQLVFFLILWKL